MAGRSHTRFSPIATTSRSSAKAHSQAGWCWLFLILVTLVTLAGCQSDEAPSAPPTEPPLPGSLQKVVIPLPSDPAGFNAYLSDTGYEEVLGELVYEGLAEMAPDGSFYAKLAKELPTRENGGISADGLTVTWKLRDHIVWSDGQPFTSDDVLFTYETLSNPNNRLAHVTGIDLIDSIDIPDDYTVVLRYREPYANMWGQFSGRGLGIFPRHACGDPGWMAGWECNTQPVGTGPFILEKWDEDKELLMVRNPLYWQTDRPFLDEIVFPIVPDDDTYADLLGDGDADIGLWLTDDQVAYLEEIEGVQLFSMPSRWLLRVVFNLSQLSEEDTNQADTTDLVPHFALSDPRVRQALDMAIDRPLLIQEAFDGHGKLANSEFFRGWMICTDIPDTPYDPDGARALLAQAGWIDLNGDGVLEAHGIPGVEDETMLELQFITPDDWDALPKAQKLIAGMWRDLGIRIYTDTTGSRDLRGEWQEDGLEAHGQFEVDLWDDGYPSNDPTDYLVWRYASWSIPDADNAGQGGNVMRFVNPQVDALLQEALLQTDPLSRRPILCQVSRVLANERPMLYLMYFTETFGFSSRLKNLVINPQDSITWDAFNWQVEK